MWGFANLRVGIRYFLPGHKVIGYNYVHVFKHDINISDEIKLEAKLFDLISMQF